MCSQKCARPEMFPGSDKEPKQKKNNDQKKICTYYDNNNKDHQSIRFHIYNILPRHYLPKREADSTGKTTLREQDSQSIFSKFFL